MRLSIANLATSVARHSLLSLGTCLGKFTKTGRFRIHITALDIIAPHARYKVWIKPNGEMPFLYGGNILKAHVGRWSDDCPEHQGVVVYSMDDTPLVQHRYTTMSPEIMTKLDQGFGVTARSTAETRRLEPTRITTFRQADVGEYLREVCQNPEIRTQHIPEPVLGGYSIHNYVRLVNAVSESSLYGNAYRVLF